MTNLLSKDLEFAIDICKQAGSIAMDYLEKGVCPEVKDDGSPVTAADKACERLIRSALAEEFPDDDILGEEEGESLRETVDLYRIVRQQTKGPQRRKWIIDPIDGTYNYVRGIPIFSTLLALEENDEVRLGVIHAPAFGDTFWAEAGHGAFKNGQPIKVSSISDVAESQFNFGSPSRIRKDGYWDGFSRLVSDTYRQRGIGDYLNFAYVLEGKAEAALEVGVQPWDLAPMKVLAREAGGRYTDLQGGESIYTGSCLISNGHVHDAYLSILLD